MNKGLQYFLAMIALFGGLYAFSKWREYSEVALLTNAAVKPDLLLRNSKKHLRDHAYDRSLIQLDQAIDAIRNIEADLDAESTRILEVSIKELEKVRMEIEIGSLVKEDMDEAFSKALNALTLAELKISEILIQQDHPRDALIALKYGMYHIKNALKYSQGDKKKYEIHIYEELDSLLENKHLTEEELISRLERMISELDTLVEDLEPSSIH